MKLQTTLHAVFPPECLCCGGRVDSDFGLCPACWADTPFITGAACDSCGAPLPGEAGEAALRCDDCRTVARPWSQGRAVFTYGGNARKLVLALKHGDRPEIARAAGVWLARAAAPLITPGMILVPIPLHRWRLLRRRFNQSALLARAMAMETGMALCPDALRRVRHTKVQDGLGQAGRFSNLEGAIAPHPRRGHILLGHDVLLVDDVMTSGATFAAATEACLEAGARNVCVISLARVAKDA